MAALSLTEQLDNLYTSTWQRLRGTVTDNIFTATPFFFWLKSKGHIKSLAGGRWIGEPVQKAKNGTAQWVTKGEAVNLVDQEILVEAKFDWRYLVGTVVRFWQDDQKNRSKYQILNLMNAKIENLKDDQIDTLETRLFGGSGDATNSMDGLQHLVSDTAAYATAVGGIVPSTENWWQNKTKDMTGSSFAANGVKEMRTMLNNVRSSKGMEKPDIILTGQNPYEYYADTMLGYYRFSDKSLVDAGFENLAFEGVPVVWSPAGGTRMYFLNTKYLWMYVDPGYFMEMTPWKTIPDQPHDRAAQVTSAMQMVTNRRRVQGVIHTIDTE